MRLVDKTRIVEMELRHAALNAFNLIDPQQKADATRTLQQQAAIAQADCTIDTHAVLAAPSQPGRPQQPRLVLPHEVPKRSPYTAEGHCALVHSIAHIEFNAINLALDAIWRFSGMPAQYYRDWLQVAAEEAQHFTLLQQHLESQAHTYGDYVAHDGLWTVCESTRHDVMARMALVPRTLEARGLDESPRVSWRLFS
jgi:uncharacterized ferritin-like protein (DUF455 family)